MTIQDGPTKAGFVALIGEPNAGKSTLLNRMVGAKVSIVTHKVQTTRARIRGVALEDESQIVFVDTPGLFRPRRRLDRAMVAAAWGGAADADIIVLLVEAHRGITDGVKEILEGLEEIGQGRKVALAINKIDRPDANPDRVRNELLSHELVVESMGGDVLAVEVSAVEKTNLDKLEEAILLQAELLDLLARLVLASVEHNAAANEQEPPATHGKEPHKQRHIGTTGRCLRRAPTATRSDP